VTARFRRGLADLRDRLTPVGSGDIGAQVQEALPEESMAYVPAEPIGPTGVAIRWVAVILVAGLLVWVTVQLWVMVINTFLALMLAAGMLPGARRFEQRSSRPVAAILINVVVIGSFLVIILIAARPALEAIGLFVAAIPDLADGLRTWIEGLIGAEAYNQLFPPGSEATLPLGGLLDLTITAVTVIANVVLIVIIEIFLLIERRDLLGGVLEFMDEEDRPATRYILRTGVESLGMYLRGLLVSMAFIGSATAVGMFLIGIPYALPMGILAFFTAAIPYIGGLIALVPILIIAAVQVGPIAVVLMIGWQVIIQQIEGSWLTPMVQGKAINVSPLVVMLGVTAGITLGGLVGGIIAIPIAALIGVGLRGVVIPLRRRAEARERARRVAYLAAHPELVPPSAGPPAEA
jgi:predicted PurR-regulated permease PerM